MAYRRTPAVQQRLDAQRDAIADAAVSLLSERGYQGLSIAAVAERAGVATGSVYRHYVDKSELMVRIFRSLCGREVDAVVAAAETARPEGAAAQVAAVVETFARRAMRNPTLAYALLAEPVDAAVDAERLVLRRAFAAAFEGAVRRGIDSGDLAPRNAALAAAALVGAVGEVLTGPLQSGAAAADTVPELVAFALRAIGARQ
ncbi:TetR/AcrR family transcriptional regulator [Rhodococcus aetherivorans]|uniref:TetR/AcrR family transcriptional regulator n=1 Tax=Rhodococcus aetherivorans TaxID=191292 RepID=UPI0002D2317F|nr:TetR/AcrR family transcriptional regulator [Rhodococcus aetherivorans]CCW10496.1 probable transcriptional regulator, ArcR family [Rhodococcus aetherivorans]